MFYVLATIIGALLGAALVYFLLHMRLAQISDRERKLQEDFRRLSEVRDETNRHRLDLDRDRGKFQAERSEFDRRKIGIDHLETENRVLKSTLRQVEITARQLSVAREKQTARQEQIQEMVNNLGRRYLRDYVKWIDQSLRNDNFVDCRERLEKAVDAVRAIGLEVSPMEAAALVSDLRSEYERIVRAVAERERQAKIKAQMREEQQRLREIEKEKERIDAERDAIESALQKALLEAKNQHTAEIEALRTKLAEAEARSRRTASMAEQTRAGNVYVISNIGSFGENVFKVGMTRRLDPNDRIIELGDASVPFPFDVHMMIASDDAPALENALHQKLHHCRINRINPRKEFFRVTFDEIRQIVEDKLGKLEYVADAEALQYRQSLNATAEDADFIESVYAANEASTGHSDD